MAAALDYGCTEITAQSRVSAVMRRLRNRLERQQASETKLLALLHRLTGRINPRWAWRGRPTLRSRGRAGAVKGRVSTILVSRKCCLHGQSTFLLVPNHIFLSKAHSALLGGKPSWRCQRSKEPAATAKTKPPVTLKHLAAAVAEEHQFDETGRRSPPRRACRQNHKAS